MTTRSFALRVKHGIAGGMTTPMVGAFLARRYNDHVPCRGLRILTASPAVSDRVKARLFWRLYESAEIRMIQRILPRDLDVIECGSSIGVTGSIICRHIAPERRLLCIEANPALLPLLIHNIAANSSGCKVDVVHAAVSSHRAASSVLFQSGESTGGQIRATQVDRSSDASVETVTLGSLRERFSVDQYSLVCDIEGGEAELLLGSGNDLRDCRFAIFELHNTVFEGTPVGPSDLLRALVEDLGFEAVARSGNVIAVSRIA